MLSIVLALCLASPSVEAESQLPAVLTLRQALEIFRARGFDLLVAEANVASASGDLTIAGALPNPVSQLA